MINLEGYGGFQFMVAAGSFCCLIRASISEWVRTVAGSSATLIGCLAAERLPMLVDVLLVRVHQHWLATGTAGVGLALALV